MHFRQGRLQMFPMFVFLSTAVLFSVVLQPPVPVEADAYSSLETLKTLIESENVIVDHLLEYLQSEVSRIDTLRKSLSSFEPLSYKGEDMVKYIGNPLNAYQLIKRQRKLFELISSSQSESLLNERLQSNHLTALSENDFRGALAGVIRLQETYKLPTEQLAQGMVQEHQTEPLKHEDVKALAETAKKGGNYELALEWFEIALDMDNDTISRHQILLQVSEIYYFLGDHLMAMRTVQPYLEEDVNSTLAPMYNMYVQQHEQRLSENGGGQYPGAVFTRNVPDWKITYEELCRGEKFENHVNPLYCRYKPTSIPIYFVKEEILFLDPRISVFYDVLSDSEAEKMRDMAKPDLYRANVGDPSKTETSEERVSKVSWLWDSGSEYIHKLSRRISLITGLQTEYRDPLSSAEPFQLVNYGVGGQYEPHVDFYEEQEFLDKVPHYLLQTGDRIVTFMFYLTQPISGGATVFPQVKVRVPAIKNAAAFWYNIRKNGEKDTRTQHAGCPVLIGEKWVANKWIREYGQEFRRPCGLDINATG